MVLTYIGLLLVIIYILVIYLKTKTIPTSVSETWYMGGKHWFTFTMVIASFLILIGLLNLTEDTNLQFVSFLTAIGMLFVGVAPEFHDTFEGTIHKYGALTLLIGSQLWLCLFSTPWCLLCWLPIIWWVTRNDWLFWCELTAILSVLIGLFLFKK